MQSQAVLPRVLPSPRRPTLPVVSCLPLVGRRQTLHCWEKGPQKKNVAVLQRKHMEAL